MGFNSGFKGLNDPHRSARRYSVSLGLFEASVRRIFTQPPFFVSAEPVASKFRTQVLMA